MPVCSPRFLLGAVIVKRQNLCIVQLPVPLRWKQGVHQSNGMRRKHIRFAPRRSVLISKGCDVAEDYISYPQQSLRPHYNIKRVICTMRSIFQRDMDNNCLLPFIESPQFGFGKASRLDPAASSNHFLSMTRPGKHHQYLNHSTASID
jgi:hypothetical protein